MLRDDAETATTRADDAESQVCARFGVADLAAARRHAEAVIVAMTAAAKAREVAAQRAYLLETEVARLDLLVANRITPYDGIR